MTFTTLARSRSTFTTPARSRSAPRVATILLPLALALALVAPAAAAPTPRLALTQVEPYFICVVCHEPLNVANAPEAVQERSTISSFIAQGMTLPQIETAMVGQYGPTVLGVPRAHGFNLVVYILPPALLLAGIASLAVILPRWRRRARLASSEAIPSSPPPDSPASRRLDEELARYKG